MRNLTIDNDMFFIKKDFYKANINKLKDLLILTEDGFFNHYKYGNVNNISNHETWGIDFDFVLIAKEGWYEALPLDFREKLKSETIKNGDALVCEDILLTKKIWKFLDPSIKDKFFRENDDELVGTNIDQIQGYKHLKKYHNHFPESHGSNCFASVLYAISKNENLINEWVFPDTLLLFLEANGYSKIEENENLDLIKSEDVLIIFDNKNPIHAVFCLDKDLCFNKLGQTMHERWSISKISDVLGEFEGQWKIYRKNRRARGKN